jgi:hypothetical protein
MTVFVLHAPDDREAAAALEKTLERRGLFAELDDGEVAQRPVQASDAVIAVLSKNFVFSPWRLRQEQRALDAWADGRLVLVKLEHHFAPVGLRDLPAIDASFEAQREFTWMKVAEAVSDLKRAVRTPAADEAGAGPSPAPRKPAGGQILEWLGALLLVAPGIAAFAVTAAIWLANRIGPSPGTLDDLRREVDSFGVRYGMPEGAAPWIFSAAMAVALIVFATIVARLVKRARGGPRSRAPVGAPAEAEAAPSMPSDAVFVSYARVNQDLVVPVIEAAQRKGRKFWLDQQGIGAGDGWAGKIVRAIKGAGGVLVMCSKAAFESDHVKREIYLADRYRKRLVPVFVEPAEPPEDFEYFFAGVQMLKLFETPEGERADAIVAAVGASS